MVTRYVRFNIDLAISSESRQLANTGIFLSAVTNFAKLKAPFSLNCFVMHGPYSTC
jgi:hypothetical protein